MGSLFSSCCKTKIPDIDSEIDDNACCNNDSWTCPSSCCLFNINVKEKGNSIIDAAHS